MTTSPSQAATQTPATPTPQAPTGAVTVGGTAVTNVGGVMTTVPTTAAEVAALRAQRRELSNQLSSATGRRDELAGELKDASGASRGGIEARIAVLDQRIVQIERDISSTGQLMAAAPGNMLSGQTGNASPSPFGNSRPDMTAISIVFTIFVLMPIAVSMARFLWKRASLPKAGPTFDRENTERLQRLESAVDSIAIEMERVSEGQRFVTKLLAESRERVKLESPRT